MDSPEVSREGHFSTTMLRYLAQAQRRQAAFAWASKHGLYITKFLLMTFAVVLVLHFQVNRPKVIHSYFTRDPFDTVREGVNYSCGCSLPTHLQSIQDHPAKSNSSLKGCYDMSELQSVRILMYPNFTGVLVDKFEDTLRYSNSSRSFTRTALGLHQTVQAHYVHWNDLDYFQKYEDILSNLYLGGFRQAKIEQPIKYLNDSAQFTVFPASYVMVAFVFACTDCDSCSLDSVNKIFQKVAGSASAKPWGNCVLWGEENKCNLSEARYDGKCEMFPIAGIPFNFAIQRFLQELQSMSGINSAEIRPFDPWHNASTLSEAASFDANVMYMNSSTVTEGSVNLSFVQLEKGSTTWIRLRDLFPKMDTECTAVLPVEVCNGTSVCNLFRNDESDGYVLKSLDLRNESQCLKMFGTDASLDDASNMWGELGISPDTATAANLMCRNYSCFSRKPPYLVLHLTAPAMRHSTLNHFLESKIVLNSWAQESGMCIETYNNTLEILESKQTMFLEANCSRLNSQNAEGYCWLTGNYHNITDLPDEDWQRRDTSLDPEPSFVCYHVSKQGFFVWVIVTFGILFGWLGTIELLFVWLRGPLMNLVRRLCGKGRLLSTDSEAGEKKSDVDAGEDVQTELRNMIMSRSMTFPVSSGSLEAGTISGRELILASAFQHRRLRLALQSESV